MASIPGVRLDITGASGSQGLLGPKSAWRVYVLPRGGHAAQDSTGTLITFDSASVASRFAASDWIQAGLNTANIRQVSAVGGNSLSVSGAALTISENDRIFLIGNTQPTVTGGSATYTTPASIIRQRDDDAADLYTNSMVTSNSDGLIQFFAGTAYYDCIVQDSNQSNQGSIIDLAVGTVEGVSVSQVSVFGVTVTFNAAIGVTGTAVFGSTVTINGQLIGNTINAVTIRSKVHPDFNIMHPDYGAIGDGATDDTAAIQAALTGASTAGGGVVLIPNKPFKVALGTTLSVGSNTIIRGLGPNASIFSSGSRTTHMLSVNGVSNVTIENLTLHQTSQSSQFGCVTVQGVCNNIVIKDCVIRDGYAGVWIKQGNRLKILDNNISNLTHPVYIGDNVDPGGGDIEGVIVRGNDIYGAISGGDGIKTIKTCHDIVIADNQIHDNAADGIDLFVSGDRVIISGNNIYDNAINGLDIKSNQGTNPPALWGFSRELLITGNQIRGSSNTGISIVSSISTDFVYNILITGNAIMGSSFYGILVEAPNVTITGNLIHGNGRSSAAQYFGVYLLGLSDPLKNCIVSSNVITNNGNNNGTAGVNMSSVTGAMIVANTFDQITGLSGDPFTGNTQVIGVAAASSVDFKVVGNHFGSGLATKLNIGSGVTSYSTVGNIGLADAYGATTLFAGSDTTPSVAGGNLFQTGNTAVTTISMFDNGLRGQRIYVLFGDTYTTIDFTGTNLQGNSDTDWNPGRHDHMTCIFSGITWFCTISDN